MFVPAGAACADGSEDLLQASPTVKRVLDTYGDRIRFVYRNFPLQNHPHARPAAEAAQCANEQGQFWAFHDRLFGEPGKLSDAELKQTAATLGLNAAQFNKCVDDHKFQKVVETDTQAGADAGVTIRASVDGNDCCCTDWVKRVRNVS